MAITIHWGSGSPYSWRVLLALEVKGLDYTSRQLQFSKGEHKAPEFLALNPRGKVPVLEDGEVVVYESLAILRYLDAAYPDPPLYGTSPAELAAIEREIQEQECYGKPAVWEVVYPLYFNPEPDAEKVRAGMEQTHVELARLEACLETRDWLATPSISAADIAFYPHLASLVRAASKPAAQAMDLGVVPLAQRYPKLAAWQARIEALPGYDETYPPHWRG